MSYRDRAAGLRVVELGSVGGWIELADLGRWALWAWLRIRAASWGSPGAGEWDEGRLAERCHCRMRPGV